MLGGADRSSYRPLSGSAVSDLLHRQMHEPGRVKPVVEPVGLVRRQIIARSDGLKLANRDDGVWLVHISSVRKRQCCRLPMHRSHFLPLLRELTMKKPSSLTAIVAVAVEVMASLRSRNGLITEQWGAIRRPPTGQPDHSVRQKTGQRWLLHDAQLATCARHRALA